MSLGSDRDSLVRLNRDIVSLRGKEAEELRKESEASRKRNDAAGRAEKASPSSRSSYLSTVAREQKNQEDAQRRRSQFASEIAKKSTEAGRLEERIAKGEADERKKFADEATKARKLDEAERKKLAKANEDLRREYDSLQRSQTRRIVELEQQVAAQTAKTSSFRLVVDPSQTEIQDFFISHAHADKADFVEGLVEASRNAGLKVWYDSNDIGWGRSIRQEIDAGLAGSYFGVVVFSPNFFGRSWTNYELDGILQKDLSGEGRLLPIWHRLTQDDVKKHAPSLAGRMALSTAQFDTEAIVEQLCKMRDKFRSALDEDN